MWVDGAIAFSSKQESRTCRARNRRYILLEILELTGRTACLCVNSRKPLPHYCVWVLSL